MAKEEMIIGGYAIVFNQQTLLWEHEGKKYYEIISPQALKGVDLSDVVLRYNHNDNVMIMAGTKNKSLELTVDSMGLRFKAKLANTTAGRDLFEMVKTGLTNKMSFAFQRAEDRIYVLGNDTLIEITKFKKILEISCVDFPAYPTTSCFTIDPAVEDLRQELKRKVELEKEKETLRKKFSAIKAEEEIKEVERLKRDIVRMGVTK